MPNRVVRDAILDSPRFHSLSSDTVRLLFFELLLLADDYGLAPAYALFLSRRTSAARRASDEAIAKMTGELADHDLVRLYQVGALTYAYIPRFGNWPRAKKPKWPMPPMALGGSEIKELQERCSAKAVQAQCMRGTHVPETGTGTGTETEKSTFLSSAGADQRAIPPCPFEAFVRAFHEALPELARVKMLDSKGRKKAIAHFWKWVFTSQRADGTARASSADEALMWVGEYFTRARSNDFLMGRTARNDGRAQWRADFDFLLTEKGKRHVIEKTEVTA